ncbi:uncharacterized protein LOC131054722 isoform X2 [Cryptomeria japonica]|uniref:uncharacterized protein LOC131054722 isoform X2 n=1 Tax=Cryptomeria japonica TaxID=3369 RepID=UPI0025AC2E76|nr:uncharacterized protein LOC131054722 isoform X2 [Cryptomeria japonica]
MEVAGSNPEHAVTSPADCNSAPAAAPSEVKNAIESLQGRVSNLVVEDGGKIRVRRKTVEDVLEECQRTFELIRTYGFHEEDDEEGDDGEEDSDSRGTGQAEAIQCADSERAQLCDLLKSRVESPAFLDKVETLHASIAQGILERAADEANSWDLVTETDLLEGEYNDSRNSLDQESYVLVREEDILEGIACFMATYLSTVKDTKDLSPKQLQKALSKTFSVRKRKGKLRMMWDSSKVIYNVVSWGATAVGLLSFAITIILAANCSLNDGDC